MTVQEFSQEFDILANSFLNNEEVRQFNEYEKSVFLTQAQEQIVVALYSGTLEGFENTEQTREYLKELIISYSPPKDDSITKQLLSNNSKIYNISSDIMFIIYESVVINDPSARCLNGKTISVLPTTYDEFHRIKNNPFRGANDRRVLRLDLGNNKVELISKYEIKNYLIRGLKKPTPIILQNFGEEITINEYSEITECTLNPILHRTILERAVQLALASRK